MSEHSSAEPRTNKKPSNSQLLLAAIAVVALIIVAVFVLANKESKPADNTKFRQDVVVPEETPKVVVNTARQEVEQTKKADIMATSEPTPVDEGIAEPVVTVNEPEPKPVEPVEPVLPSLDDSDISVRDSVASYLSKQAMELLVTEDMVRRSVVFIDNLAQGKVAKKHYPVSKPTDNFMVIEDDLIITDPNSFERYTPYVNMLNAMSTAQLVRLYEQYKPLISEAYEEIGYNGNEFDYTLQEALGELLETPIPESNLPLIQESVTYKYAYAEWEQLSDAQKLFLRMGPENMKKAKKRLQAFQRAIAN
ncbi:DUF3014 domain-containing protein [Pseudoalteromonas luteoviolacea]|uniref:DUF3014 domain-containing protein n=1 Tax=Pseudoalteromonas luteoviolacea S4054 TaxID=1129367 RepID=A0A0F6AFQ0_9GAMM|nr:DUF3014 domain-containing protein [Pseudoalteromonas luteoviolacea]AOT07554.1 hypothetical protein S4054249_06725 [Pseudoalteromonas luteoviolacea]AOT12470.1 hypothetical protein S40542_06725 [Pseudoalteromonas luteoviolacea]AOT17384.1 hypothetical protein S4054_06725 [Pseudoalteromonas luteoviolacea]KKE84631.1 hypothetical protein N479_07945 [Pseudoalteromonas luteoviolacea S4054]KZN74269.1 hypothetical protein N481_09820 [Pseudoalteromonas luteoviolacea S4047-1]